MKILTTLALLIIGLNVQAQEICTLRITNTLMQTNKSTRCKAFLNEQTKTLTLTSIDHPTQSFKMVIGNSGVCVMKFYENGIQQSEKVVYRRSDMEKNDGRLIYTSRTGEIIISLAY